MNLNSYVTRHATLAGVFPCLMEASHGGFIVLFHDSKRGTVLSTNGELYDVGDYSDSWDMDSFVPFIGNVTIGDPSSVSGGAQLDESQVPFFFGMDTGADPDVTVAGQLRDGTFEILGQTSGIPFGNTGWCGPGCTCFPQPVGQDANPANEAGLDLSAMPAPIRAILEALRAAGADVTIERVG